MGDEFEEMGAAAMTTCIGFGSFCFTATDMR